MNNQKHFLYCMYFWLSCLLLYSNAYSDVYFQGRYEYQLGTEPYDIKYTDVNNDGHIDLIISKKGYYGISLLIGKGDGYFNDQQVYSFFPPESQSQIIFNDEMIPLSFIIHDINNDHINDIIVAIPFVDSISILKGLSGSPYYQRPDQLISFREIDNHSINPEIYPCSIGYGDFDKNGLDDLVIAFYLANKIAILFNDGNGILNNQNRRIVEYTGDMEKLFNPIFVLTLDINDDSYPDVAVANWGSASISIFINNQQGGLTYIDSYATGNYPRYITKGDFNNDHFIDLAVTNSQGNTISVLLGNNDGSFQSNLNYDTGILPICIETLDFNKDSYTDLCVVNRVSNTISLLENNKNGTFFLFRNYIVANKPTHLCISDFNHDDYKDFAIISKDTNNVSIIFGKENGQLINGNFFNAGKEVAFFTTYDIDSDNRQDIITANYNEDSVSILSGIGGGGFDNQLKYKTEHNPKSLVVCNVNNDDHADLAVANYGNDSISIFLGDGKGYFNNCNSFKVGEGPVALTLCHLDNDYYLDLVALNSKSNDLTIRFGQKHCLFKEPFSVHTKVHPMGFIMDDFDEDQLLDTIVLNTATNNVSIYLKGKAFEEQMNDIVTGSEPYSIDSGDFNKDGYQDIVFSNKGSSSVTVLLGDGNGSFYTNNKNEYTVGLSPVSLKLGDLDQDNNQDIVVANVESKNVSVLFGLGDGTFKKAIFYGTGEKPSHIELSDIDQDSDLDIIVANAEDNNILVLHNTKNNTIPFIKEFSAKSTDAKNIYHFICSAISNQVDAVMTYSINFGDGHSDTNDNGIFSHKYTSTGSFSAQCTVDNAGETLIVKPLLINIEKEESNTNCFVSVLFYKLNI